MKNNKYIPILYDIVVPEKYEDNMIKINCLFLVMEHVQKDVKSILEGNSFNQEN